MHSPYDDGAPGWSYAKLLGTRPWLRYNMGNIWRLYCFETGTKKPPSKAHLYYLRRYAVNLLRMEFCNVLPFDDNTRDAMRYVH